MVLVKQHTESGVPESTNPSKVQPHNAKDPKFTMSGDPPPASGHKTEYFVAKVWTSINFFRIT
ncbi:SH3 domain-containing protein 2-like [Iris pallida]|uniref:SH3 domain-containing protein 2-like n=1 Tax=Iris pallida TaxID=29817 RepID=A0AAX6GJG6_IRIPA|nr:SH3 domain-containing protein 2-like [Iris pallida]